MRPAGEIRQALFQAAHDLTQHGRGATLVELAARASVARRDASVCLKNMRRAGVLDIVGERRVDYRNRPVAEYAPAPESNDSTIAQGWADLNLCMADWVR